MKEEIKEILDNIRKIIKSNRENDFNRIIYDCDSMEKLLDCITNLQEENKSLRTRIKTIKRRRKKQTHKKNIYKSRNEKAIEYCNYNDESLYTFEPDYDYEENMVDNYEPSNFREDLLNILNGGDEE